MKIAKIMFFAAVMLVSCSSTQESESPEDTGRRGLGGGRSANQEAKGYGKDDVVALSMGVPSSFLMRADECVDGMTFSAWAMKFDDPSQKQAVPDFKAEAVLEEGAECATLVRVKEFVLGV